MSENNDDFQKAALHYHEHPKPGKLEIQATKPLGSQRDLALAYSPGVAAPCMAIYENPNLAANYTARGNLVAVITNGTAVLGLGNIGPLASKPVMEGKAVLFKKFADIDVFDIEVDSNDIDSFVDTVANLEPTFGGINLEDIKAPECFEIEKRLRNRLKIPIFHDDQHGTAIIVCAAVLNGLDFAGKKIENAKFVVSGAGAAALACLNLLVTMGAKKQNIWISDIKGVVYEGREALMDPYKAVYAQRTNARTLEDIMDGADVFLGLSAANVLPASYLKKMAATPLILALANPVPEIMPEEAYKERPDALICTGRSDYPNQVNNVLCFPYIFKGALDVGATAITEEMKIAAVKAIANLAREVVPDNKEAGEEYKKFGADYLIPSPLDQRLLLYIAPAVAQAAMDMNIALRPIKDMAAYRENLHRYVYKSGLVMRPIFALAKKILTKKVIYADGEDERVLRTAKIASEEGLAEPILIGRKRVIEEKLQQLGIVISLNKQLTIWDPLHHPYHDEYTDLYLKIVGGSGITFEDAKKTVCENNTVFAALAVMRGDADSMLCGLNATYHKSLDIVKHIIGIDDNKKHFSALSLLVLRDKVLFLIDTQINLNPTAEEIASITIDAVNKMRLFGITPKIAFLAHSSDDFKENIAAIKMCEAAKHIKSYFPKLSVDGEIFGDIGLNPTTCHNNQSTPSFAGEANLLVFPNLDAANITLNVLKQTTEALHVGPILLGSVRSAHIITPSITSRGILNMTAIAVCDTEKSSK